MRLEKLEYFLYQKMKNELIQKSINLQNIKDYLNIEYLNLKIDDNILEIGANDGVCIEYLQKKNFKNIKYLNINEKEYSKIKRELKWNCKYSFIKGIEKTINWYLENFNNNYFKNKNFEKRIGLITLP